MQVGEECLHPVLDRKSGHDLKVLCHAPRSMTATKGWHVRHGILERISHRDSSVVSQRGAIFRPGYQSVAFLARQVDKHGETA